MSSISPNMSLVLPGVGVTIGPQWATDLNSSLSILDGHNHSAGSGVQITPSGLDINSELSFKANNATELRSVRMTIQAAPLALATDLGCLYVSGVDLYFNDENGNQIQITDNGGIAGTPGSISNLTSPASASYVSGTGTFVWQSNTNVAANLDAASIILRNTTASSNGLTLSPPTLSSNYSIVLPALPASVKFMTLDNSGNMAATYGVDNSTIEISSNNLQLKDGGITNAKVNASAAIARSKLASVGQQLSSSSGIFTTTSSSPVDVTSVNVTITTTGRPVFVGLISDGSANDSFLECIQNSVVVDSQSEFYLVRDASIISRSNIRVYDNTAASRSGVPPGCVFTIDTPAAGTYTYKMQVGTQTGSTVSVNYVKLIAYEIA